MVNGELLLFMAPTSYHYHADQKSIERVREVNTPIQGSRFELKGCSHRQPFDAAAVGSCPPLYPRGVDVPHIQLRIIGF